MNIYGIGAFVKKNIEVINEGEIIIHHNPDYHGVGPTHSRSLQWMKCCDNNQIFHIMNVHGLWNGKGKTDSSERIEQSYNIKKFVDSIATPKILCGDFNLRPDTKSLRIIEESLENLIVKHDIHSTRTSYYEKEEKYADYVFTSKDISINTLQVLNDEVSDHAPLLLDFSL